MDESKVTTSFAINDGVTGTLNNITSAIKGLISSMDKLGKLFENLDKTSLDKLEDSVGDVDSKLDEAAKSAKDTTSEVTSLNKTSLNQLDSGLDRVSVSTNDIASQAAKADSALDSLSRDNLGALNSDLSKAETNLNSLATSASKAESKINSFDDSKINQISSAAKDAKRDIGKIPEELDKVKEVANEASDSVNSIGEGIDTGGIGEALSSIGSSAKLGAFSSMLDIAGQVVEKVKEIASVSMDAAGQMDSLRNSFTVGLGASAEEAARYMTEAQETFAQGYGESLDEVATQMTYVKQTLGDLVDTSELSDLTAEFMTLDQSGMDFNETVRGVKNLMVNFGIDSQNALDLMTVGMQRGLNASDELGDNIAEYSGRWADAGVSASEYFSMLEAGMQNGAYSLDKVGDYLNEFLTSMDDGRMEENIGSFSTQTQMLFQQWQNGSATQKQVFDSVIADLGNMTSETERAALASTLWSSLGEDNAMDMILALGGVSDSYADIAGAANKAKEDNSSAVAELSNRWELFKTQTLAPVGEVLAQLGLGMFDIIDSIGPFFQDCGQHIYAFLDGIRVSLENFGAGVGQTIDRVKGFFGELGAWIGSVFDSIKTQLGNLSAWFSEKFELIKAAIADAGAWIGEKIDFVKGKFEEMQTWLTEKVDFIKNKFTEIGSAIGDGIGQGLGTIQQKLQPIIDRVTSWLPQSFKDRLGISSPSKVFQDEIGFNIVEGLKLGIQNAWGSLTAAANNLWTSFLNIFNGGQDEDEKQIVDYTAQIDRTKEQLAELQFEVQTGYDSILSTVQTKNAEIVAAGIGMFTQMTSTVIMDAQNMVTGIGGVFSQIPGVVGNTFAAALPVVQENLIAITAMANDQIGQLVARAQQALYEIIPAFTAVLEALKNNVLSIIESMNQGILEITNTFGDSYVDIFSRTFDEVIALFGVFQTRAVAATNDLINAINRALNPKLPNVFKDAANTAMSEFVAGIRSRIGDATSATSELVEQVKATFVKGLGIHSPSAIAYWYGQMTGQGFINGLSDSQVADFAKHYLTEIVNAFAEGKFNADELVDFLGEDSLKVVHAIQEDPELMGIVMETMLPAGAGGSILDVAAREVGYRSPWGTNNSKYNPFPGAWCAMFVKWCADQAGVPFPAIYYVPGLRDYAYSHGIFESPGAGHAGDAAFMKGFGHIGIAVQPLGGSSARVIDGNTWWGNDGVGVYDHVRHDICGYMHLSGAGSAYDPSQPVDPSILSGAPIGAGMGYSSSAGAGAARAIENAFNKKHGYDRANMILGQGWGPEDVGTKYGNIPFDPNGGVEQWRSTVETALGILGLSTSSTNDLLATMRQESGGDPNSLNDWDSNWYAGYPSKGLMQMIGPTFVTWHLPGYNNIWDPLSNILASIRYQMATYHNLGPKLSGYAVGTRYVPEDMLAMIHKGEAIIPANQNPYRDSGGDYLTEIAERSVVETPDLSMQNLAGEVIPMYSSGNSNVVVNLSFGDINNHGDLDNAKDEIVRFVEQEMTATIRGTGSVIHGY